MERCRRAACRNAPRSEAGVALLVVLILLVILTGSSVAFVWFMNQQQARVGNRLRSAAAMAVAEAGIHRALAILESVTPDGPSAGRGWRPAVYSETVPAGAFEGTFTLSLADGPGGSILITSAGNVGGVTRRLRARVFLSSPAMLVAIYGSSIVRLEGPPAATYILPYGAGIGDRPWVHMASGQAIWIATMDAAINRPSAELDAAAGPVDALASGRALPAPGPLRLMLADGADLRIDQVDHKVSADELRVGGINIQGVEVRAGLLPGLPEVDREFYRAQATANAANAALNKAAGRYAGNSTLALKRDSLYGQEEFQQIQTYLKAGVQPQQLRGVIYVAGGVTLDQEQHLQIADGALVTDATIQITQRSSLEVTHSAATRTLPGIIVLDKGEVVITQNARLRVHGLVYASHVFDVSQGARVDIVGSILGNDPGFSFVNMAATVVIRYDPAVMGTQGLHVPDDTPVVAWVAAWEELP